MSETLDLHGIKHVDVPRTVDRFLGKMLMYGINNVIIITGKSKKMKNILKEVLLDYKLNYVENIMNSGEVFIELK